MKILQLSAENFARLQAVEIRPDGPVVEITGVNGEGKTSCLNSIWATLKGRSAAPPEPIRKGEEKAVIRLDLGTDAKIDMSVVRTFTRNKDGEATTGVTVTVKGNKVLRSPQAVIDAALGVCTIDPLAFARAPAKEQFDTVRSLIPSIDFDDIARRRKEAYDERTMVNRRKVEAEANVARIVLPPGPQPKAAGDLTELVAQLQQAGQHNATVARDTAERHRLRGIADQAVEEARKLRDQANELEAKARKIDAALDDAEDIPAPIDTVALQQKITDARKIETVLAEHQKRRQLLVEVVKWEKESYRLTQVIEDIDADKTEAIAAARLPVDGLSFGDGVVLLGGVPLAQAAMSEKIKVSTQLAMALNKEPDKIRVLTIDEASELDSKSRAMILKMAQENNYQVWLARVNESGDVGFVIEDGKIAS